VLLLNIIKIYPYHFELYLFKVGPMVDCFWNWLRSVWMDSHAFRFEMCF